MNNKDSLVYGQLNQETFNDFVSRLAVEQSGNRPHATANPLFSVQNEKIVWTRDDESSHQLSRIFFCVDDNSSFDSYEEMLTGLDGDDSDLLEAYITDNNVDTSDLEDIAEAINTVFDDEYEACVMYGNYEWEHINTHITPEAAHAFIERKKHDYRKLRVYAVSAYWCWEMKAIIDGLVNGSIQYVDKATSNKVDNSFYEFTDGLVIALCEIESIGSVGGDPEWLKYTVRMKQGNTYKVYENRKYLDGKYTLRTLPRESLIKIWKESIIMKPVLSEIEELSQCILARCSDSDNDQHIAHYAKMILSHTNKNGSSNVDQAKHLKWKERESGGTELRYKGELLAIVSYSDYGWYWYSVCSEVKLNTLNTKTSFSCFEEAQAHCQQHMSHALTITRGRK
ncbi:hypothetical protein VXS06_14675 [Photobacterium toruni]|uniref:Uncharacterized protein n=1 Tax=Photobacterium toruni TaxID=1935446 RepID=A0ABU6L9M6_9GAMM|nr:hypothetical protein [Photobacterium toruni]